MKRNLFALALGGLAVLAGVGAQKPAAITTLAEDDKVIKPLAKYDFQDAENLGKDVSGNEFDLVLTKTSAKDEAIQQLEEDGEKYLAIRHDAYGSGTLKDTGGAWLYAPELGNTNKDFSDLIDGSYTISITMRADYYFSEGNRYALNFGRYCSAITIVPWAAGIEVSYANADFYNAEDVGGIDLQKWLEGSRYICPIPEERNNTWVTLSITGDVDTGKIRIYLDGEFRTELNSPFGTRLTNVKTDLEASSYAFCIGGQCDVRGGSIDPLIGGFCDYKQVSVYDCKLSDENVKALYEGQSAYISKQAADKQNYVTDIQAIKAEDYDLDITDTNTIASVISNQFAGKKLKVTTSDGNSRSYPTIWYYTADGLIKGKALVDDAINCDNTQAAVTYKYVVKLNANLEYVDISEVYVDNKEYEFGDEVTLGRHTVKFIVTPKKGVTISTVTFNDMDWEPEEDDEIEEGSYLYIITFTKGAYISIVTDGEPEGSHTDNGGSTKKGCGGSIIATSGIVSCIALLGAGLLCFRKKED